MRPEWLKYGRISRRPLLKNIRWERMGGIPGAAAKGFWAWLMSSQQDLSPARVTNYVSCPQKFKYVSVDKRPTRPSPHLGFYKALHGTIIEFHKRFQTNPQTTLDDLLAVYQELWDSSSFSDEEQESLFYKNGLRILEVFLKENKGLRPPDMLRKEIEVTVDGIPLKVTLDRIDKIDKKHWRVTLYKTGQRVLEGSTLAHDIKTQMLYLVIRTRWPKINLEIRYYYLDAGKIVPIVMRTEELAAARRHLHQANRGLKENDYPPRPSPLCGWCDFQSECSVWKGYVTDKGLFRLSYSKMMTYVRCPRNYKFLYIDRVAPLARNFFSIGTTLHNALEEFYNYDGILKQPSFDYLVKLYRTHWVNAGYADEAEERRYFEEGLQMLGDYYRMEIKGKYKKAWSTEPYFELPIGENCLMIGFIDRIDHHDDGSYEVIDYKTEPKLRTQEEVDNDLQLTIYFWACREAFGIAPDKLTLHFMRHNKKISTRRTDEDIRKLIDYVDEISGKMKTETEFQPLVNKYCGSCDHLRGCPKEPEVLEEMRKGKTLHAITPILASPEKSPSELLPEEAAAQEKDVEKKIKKLAP